MKRCIQFLVIALAAALGLGRAAAGSPFNEDFWTTADGIPQSSVIAITQTHDGYLWLGTLNGLARFDGHSFTPFNLDNTPGLPGNRIVFLSEDSHSNLWVGTDNAGLCVIQNGEVKRFDATVTAGRVTYSYEDTNGAVWFRTSLGYIFCWRNGALEAHTSDASYDFALNLFNLSWHTNVLGKSGSRWELGGDRVVRVNPDHSVTNFGRSPWLRSPKNVPFGSPGRQPELREVDATVNAAIEDNYGNLVVGTDGNGIYWSQPSGEWWHVFFGNANQDTILSLWFDRDNNLWVGTDGGGICRVKKSYFDNPPGLGDGVARSLAEDSAGGLWATFNAQGLTYSLTNDIRHFGVGTYSNAWCVLVDRQQRIWAGTRGEGLFKLETGASVPAGPPGSAYANFFSLLEDRAGRIWAGSDSSLGCFDGQAWRSYAGADGLPPYAVRALAEDSKGTLWIGTEAGLYTLRGNKVLPTNAPITDISCLLVDENNVLWAGSSGHGLARFADGLWTRCTTTNGLPVDDIGYLIEDGDKNLWIGSYEGLLRIDNESLSAFAADPGKKVFCRMFLPTECSAGAQPAAIRTRNGRLLFPTTDGVKSVNPADLKRNRNPPPVVIESVLVDGLPQASNPLNSTWSQPVVLIPENEQLEIHFTALNFSAPKDSQFGTRFRFQFSEHVDKDNPKNWTDIGTERVAHFQKLPPGNYTFLVQACNEDGVWNTTGASIAVIVEPPFWRKPGFIAASVLIFLGVLAGTIYLISTAKLKRQLRLAQQKEMIEFERARIARDLHDQLGANLTQITLLGEMAETDKEIPEEIEQHAQQICTTARETTRSLDEIVWAVNPSNDTLESLTNYACKYAQDYFAMAGVSYRAELPPGLPPVPILPEVRHNIFLAFKEAVNNVVKHAQATEARVKLQLEPGQFVLSVADNGRGLGDVSEKKLRNGLRNMRQRLSDVHGQFDIAPGPQGGTMVKLTVPIKN